MDPAIYEEFLKSYIAEHNSILAQRNAHYTAAEAELAKLKSRQKVLVQALTDNIFRPDREGRDDRFGGPRGRTHRLARRPRPRGGTGAASQPGEHSGRKSPPCMRP